MTDTPMPAINQRVRVHKLASNGYVRGWVRGYGFVYGDSEAPATPIIMVELDGKDHFTHPRHGFYVTVLAVAAGLVEQVDE